MALIDSVHKPQFLIRIVTRTDASRQSIGSGPPDFWTLRRLCSSMGRTRRTRGLWLHSSEHVLLIITYQVSYYLRNLMSFLQSTVQWSVISCLNFKYQKFRVRVNHKIKHNQTQVGFIYIFWYSLSSTSSILEFANVQFRRISTTFQNHFKICLLWFYMKKNVALTLVSFAVLK